MSSFAPASSRALARGAGIGAVAAVPIAFLCVFFLYPVCALLWRGIAPHDRVDLNPLGRVWESSATAQVVWFTVWSAGAATLVTLVLGLPVAHALYRLTFPGRDLLRGIVTLPFVMPTVVVGLAFTQLFGGNGWLSWMGLSGTGVAIVVGLVYFNVGVVVRTVGRFWQDLDPRLGQAAAALGASPIRVWFTITLRSLLPAIAAAASVVFLFCATAFGVVLMMGGLRYSNLETEIYYLTTQQFDLPSATALSVLQLVAIVVLLLLVGRIRPRRLTRVPTAPRRPRRSDAAALFVTGVVMVAVLIPLISLAVASVRRNGHWTLHYFRALTTDGIEPGGGTALLISPMDALGNSLQNAALATTLALLLGLLVAYLLSRSQPRGRWTRVGKVLDGVFMLPLGVSAVTLGFGFLITLNRAPLDLRGSFWLIPIAQALVALPLVVRTVVPIWRSIDDRQRHAAATLGASPWQVLLSVDLAAVGRAALTAAGFALAVSMGEFGATSFLARDNAPTLPVVIYKLLSHPGSDNFGMAVAAATILAVVSAGLTIAFERFGERSGGVW
ncbi:MAG: ABC transporter permease [Marmoricola sp.]